MVVQHKAGLLLQVRLGYCSSGQQNVFLSKYARQNIMLGYHAALLLLLISVVYVSAAGVEHALQTLQGGQIQDCTKQAHQRGTQPSERRRQQQ